MTCKDTLRAEIAKESTQSLKHRPSLTEPGWVPRRRSGERGGGAQGRLTPVPPDSEKQGDTLGACHAGLCD